MYRVLKLSILRVILAQDSGEFPVVVLGSMPVILEAFPSSQDLWQSYALILEAFPSSFAFSVEDDQQSFYFEIELLLFSTMYYLKKMAQDRALHFDKFKASCIYCSSTRNLQEKSSHFYFLKSVPQTQTNNFLK